MIEHILGGILSSFSLAVASLYLLYLWWTENLGRDSFLLPLSAGLLLLALGVLSFTLDVIIQLSVLLSLSGSLLVITGIIQGAGDIRGRLALIRELARRREQLEQITSTIEYGILRLDKQGHITYLNEYGLQVTGHRSEDVLGRHFHLFIPSEYRLVVQTHWLSLVHRGEFEAFEFKVKKKTGDLLDVRVKKAVVEEEGVSLIFEDITMEVRAEEEKKSVMQRAERLFNSLPDAVYLEDLRDGRILDANTPASEQLNMPRRAIKMARLPELFSPETAEQLEHLGEMLKHQGMARIAGRARRRDGSTFPVEIHAGLVEGEHALVVVRDITAREHRFRELTASSERLSRFNQAITRLSGTKDLKQLYQHLADIVSEAFNSPYVVCCMQVDEGLYKPYLSSAFSIDAPDMLFEFPDICAVAARTREVQVVEDYLRETNMAPQGFLASMGFRSAMAAPLVWDDRVFGTIKILSKKPADFHREEIEGLGELSRHAASIIHLLRQLEDTEDLIDHLQVLQPLNREILTASGNTDVLNKLVRTLVQRFSITAACIEFAEPEMRASHGLRGTTPPFRDIAELAARTGKPQRWQYIDVNPAYGKWHVEASSTGYRSAAAVPVEGGGMMILYSHRPDDFSDERLKAISLIIDTTAIIVRVGNRLREERASLQRAQRRLNAVAHVLSAQNPPDIYTSILKQAASLVNSSTAALFMEGAHEPLASIGDVPDWRVLVATGSQRLLHIPLRHHRRVFASIKILPPADSCSREALEEAEQLCHFLTPLLLNSLRYQQALEQTILIDALHHTRWCRRSEDHHSQLQCILSGAVELLSANHAAIILQDDGRGEMYHSLTGDDLLRQLLREHPEVKRELHRINATASIVVSEHEITRSIKTGIKSLLVTPLPGVKGFMCCATLQHRSFTEMEQETLEYLAVCAASQLEILQHRDALEGLEKQLDALKQLTTDATADPSLKAVLSRVLSHAIGLTGADSGIAALSEGNRITEVSSLNISERICEDLLLIRNPLIITDYTTHPERTPLLLEEGVKTLLCVPLMHQNTPLGVMGVFRKTPHPFTQGEHQALRSLVPSAVLAIIRAREHAELEQMQGEWKERLAVREEELHRTRQALLNLIEDLGERGGASGAQ